MKLILSTVAVTVVGILMCSCAPSSRSNENKVAPAAAIDANNPTRNTSAPTPGAMPVNLLKWTSIQERLTLSKPTPKDCEMPLVFTVQHDGTFMAGPCTQSNDIMIGKITKAELDELNSNTTQLTETEPVTANKKECSPPTFKETMFVSLLHSALEQDLTIADTDTKNACYFIHKAQAMSLSSYLNSLLAKYYPKR